MIFVLAAMVLPYKFQSYDPRVPAINEAMLSLSEQQKRVFTKGKTEGKSYDEIGQELGITHATIHTHMSRAVKQIREYIRIHHGSALGLALAAAMGEMASQSV